MQITDALNLALPVGDGLTAYHTPISRQVYETNYDLLNSVKSTISGKGNQYLTMSGAAVASLTLRDEARKDAQARGQLDVKGNPSEDRAIALLAEIKRLTMILVPSASGYDTVPIDAAISSGKIDDEDWGEVESSIVFFTSYVLSARKASRAQIAPAVASILSASITSLPPMAFAASLPTSTRAAPTPSQASSLPV